MIEAGRGSLAWQKFEETQICAKDLLRRFASTFTHNANPPTEPVIRVPQPKITTMRTIPLLLCFALIIPAATAANDGTKVTTKASGQDVPHAEKTDAEGKFDTAEQRPADRFLDTFDLFDSFLPHFPLTFLDRSTHAFGLDQDIFRRSSPRYDLSYEPNSVTMKVEVPGYNSKDISVEVKSGGRVLSISANKEIHDDEEHSISSSHFQQLFTLDHGVETEKLTANLAGGVLTLKAPRHATLPPNRKIPITHLDQATVDEANAESTDDDVLHVATE